MPLTTGQRAALYAFALILIALGGTGTQAAQAGLGVQASYILLISGIVGTALVTAYSLGTPPTTQIEQMRKLVSIHDAKNASTNTPK